MIYLLSGDMPVIYRFGYADLSIFVDIQDPLMQWMRQNVTHDWPILNSLATGVQIPKFVLPTEPKWGFGARLKSEQLNTDWWRVSCPIPGKDECRHSVTASLYTLLAYGVGLGEEEVERIPTNESQLLHIDGLGLERSVQSHGAGIHLTISETLAQWIEAQSQGGQPSTQQAMIQAFEHMFGKPVTFQEEFQCRFYEGKWAHLKVSGNCACLGRDGQEAGDDRKPYDLFSHNVDYPIQQLSLLAGIGEICSRAHKDLYG